MVIISLSIAFFNMLPIYPLDRGVIIASLLEKFIKDDRKLRAMVLSIGFICTMLIYANLGSSYRALGNSALVIWYGGPSQPCSEKGS